MLDKSFAEHFATDWIDSWNSHNLKRILAHYKDDFESEIVRDLHRLKNVLNHDNSYAVASRRIAFSMKPSVRKTNLVGCT
jgi:midasin (ATPase involved in ribosome maturation)